MNGVLEIQIPEWQLPLDKPCRYLGVKGGRGSGKSHYFAEKAVESLLLNPNTKGVCIREIQKSLKYSAKQLIEDKIHSFGVGYLFTITQTEIKSTIGSGLIIFQGMQDHTADSIKSLEGFDWAWVEEAHTLSDKSLKLLRPTIRKENSQVWFSWNPENETDPVDEFLVKNPPKDSIVVHVNIDQNPFVSQTLIDEMEHDRKTLPDEMFQWIWKGGYNTRSKRQVFGGKFTIQDFEREVDWIPLYGLDFGFSQDPTAVVECFVRDQILYIRKEAGGIGLELDHTSDYVNKKIVGIDRYVIEADSARPESISYLKRKGLPRIKGVKKWAGSIEDGIKHMLSYKEIIIHPECKETIKNFRLYSYKEDKRTGNILPDLVDANNDYIDAIRYALSKLIRKKQSLQVISI